MAYVSFYPYTWEGARDTLAKRKAGYRESARIGNNTYLETRGQDYAVRYHNTDVVTYHADGTVTVYTAGWNTTTTSQRLHAYARNWLTYYTPSKEAGWHVFEPDPELTPAKVQKCRTCHGTGKVAVHHRCYERSGWWQADDGTRCQGNRTDHDWPKDADGHTDYTQEMITTVTKCPHDSADRHVLIPCSHGVWGFGHDLPDTQSECHRCNGTGRCDYGSKPIGTYWGDGRRLRLDSDGRIISGKDGNYVPPESTIGPAGSPHYKAPKYAPYEPSSYSSSSGKVPHALATALPDFGTTVKCPRCEQTGNVKDAVIHLNDGHRMSREEIADWLDSLDADLTFRTI